MLLAGYILIQLLHTGTRAVIINMSTYSFHVYCELALVGGGSGDDDDDISLMLYSSNQPDYLN